MLLLCRGVPSPGLSPTVMKASQPPAAMPEVNDISGGVCLNGPPAGSETGLPEAVAVDIMARNNRYGVTWFEICESKQAKQRGYVRQHNNADVANQQPIRYYENRSSLKLSIYDTRVYRTSGSTLYGCILAASVGGASAWVAGLGRRCWT